MCLNVLKGGLLSGKFKGQNLKPNFHAVKSAAYSVLTLRAPPAPPPKMSKLKRRMYLRTYFKVKFSESIWDFDQTFMKHYRQV